VIDVYIACIAYVKINCTPHDTAHLMGYAAAGGCHLSLTLEKAHDGERRGRGARRSVFPVPLLLASIADTAAYPSPLGRTSGSGRAVSTTERGIALDPAQSAVRYKRRQRTRCW
jgi:hypothetical protein